MLVRLSRQMAKAVQVKGHTRQVAGKPVQVRTFQRAGTAAHPEDHPRYFEHHPDAELVPMSKIRPTRSRPKGIERAGEMMRGAYEGTHPKRTPVALREDGDGTYSVKDGNSTYANAKASDWKHLYGVVERPKTEPVPFERLPEEAKGQFFEAYREHQGRLGDDAMSEDQARLKFAKDFHEALTTRVAYDRARLDMETQITAALPKAKVYGRTKSPESMAGKLVRQGLPDFNALSDIGGSTIVAESAQEQRSILDVIKAQLKPWGATSWSASNFDDYTASPKGGYRAIHLTVDSGGRPMELQVKTTNQLRWSSTSHATLYSKLDNPLKHSEEFRSYMLAMSEWLAKQDAGDDPGAQPPCPPEAQQYNGCV